MFLRCIIPLLSGTIDNAALGFHWPLHSSGASPRVWSCNTRPLLHEWTGMRLVQGRKEVLWRFHRSWYFSGQRPWKNWSLSVCVQRESINLSHFNRGTWPVSLRCFGLRYTFTVLGYMHARKPCTHCSDYLSIGPDYKWQTTQLTLSTSP